MKKLIITLTVFIILILSGCFYALTGHLIVSQRGDINTINTTINCDINPLTHQPQGSAMEQVTGLNSKGFSLMNWNMLKGKKIGWKRDFRRFSTISDLIIIQEACLSDDLWEALQKNRFNWDLATSFEFKKKKIGVLTASMIEPDYQCTFQNEEPLIQIPKNILITRYPLSETDQKLLVANVHLINFTLSSSKYRAQLLRMEQILSKHQGPLIVSGDFNSWNSERLAIVDTITKRLRLKPVHFDKNYRISIFGHNVDHIFYRGLEPFKAVVSVVTSSDHNPMWVTFRLADNDE
jgi:endonuclease/exonuclease/phosphatase (EEP) superfamily protein YafD